MKITVKDRKVRYEPEVTIVMEVTVGDVTELLECSQGFYEIISELAASTPGLGGCQLHGKLEEQLTNLGLIRRSTRGSHNRTELLTREMAEAMIAAFEEEFYKEVAEEAGRKIKLRCQNNVGAGREIQALLPKGFKLEHTGYVLEEELWSTVWYERWVQFPTEDWEALQDEIMQAVQKVLENHGETDENSSD